ncbi:MAG: Cobyrinic acid A,C-diamide synthase [Planctomycetes bacterium ADurb.Bin126]|nr:MAG: Cobyrinic acid A,C-diamide synthase [Planctomycetes bacterium ADurb.Bin126]HOD80508.1 cobyrinate a,c-diamide synthase [Phycisphaerae bacterium]HQL72120.1 cobyrinate a,c-diamide synthase [Phycisphaerae bacterium]
MSRVPTILLGGTASGVGKTSLTLGIVRAMRRRGMRVQTFKVGPDFLDPTYLAAASGRTCYNLDGWMTGRDYVRGLFARACGDADLAVIEGVMGLFDGAEADSLEGSSAQVAAWLDSPVLLVANAHGASRSLAAAVRGFASFEPSVRVAGVIANRCGSDRHVEGLRTSLQAASCPPLVGAIPRDALPALQHRHLGLLTADSDTLTEQTLEALADAAERWVELDAVMALARTGRNHQDHEDHEDRKGRDRDHKDQTRCRIGVARDRAFHFYYPDNLEALRAAGAELAEFSPLTDRELPEGVDGLYFGGGYPEVHAAELAANAPMRTAVREFADRGGCIYAECGGLIYLGRTLRGLDGASHQMAGVLPVVTRMLERLRTLGYVEVELAADAAWGAAGQRLRGHEFHYSEIESDELAGGGWERAYRLNRRRGGVERSEGFQRGRVLASYVHLHWASRPEAAGRLVDACGRRT